MRVLLGHAAAIFTVFVWGITFISTKVLLASFTPEAILFIRFLMGFLALAAIEPRLPRWLGLKTEASFAAAGFFGIALYFLLENIALQHSQAANVGVIVSTTPFFTALAEWRVFGGHKPAARFYFGFMLAIAGVSLIAFSHGEARINPAGDMLALGASLAWAFYSGFTRRAYKAGLGSLRTTRRIFFYGLIFMLPLLPLHMGTFNMAACLSPANLANLLFLGLGASALCFATWTFCLESLGTDRASAYIYLVPVITVAAAAIMLHEAITCRILAGMALVITGLAISESRWRRRAINRKAAVD